MSLDNPTTFEKALSAATGFKYWRIVGVVAALALLSIGIMFMFDKCSDIRFNRGMKQANANLVNALDNLSNIQDKQAEKEKELQKLQEDEASQKQIVIQAAKDAEEAAKAERDAQLAANQAAENVNAINAKDFSNTSLENANKARCRAFPDAPECAK